MIGSIGEREKIINILHSIQNYLNGCHFLTVVGGKNEM